MKIEILNNTFVKAKPLESSMLRQQEKRSAVAGDILESVGEILIERSHFKFQLEQEIFTNHKFYYVFQGHARLLQEKGEFSLPESVKLNVSYKSQLDNHYNPTGSCNVTSVAMVLDFLGCKGNQPSMQLEDELYEYCENLGLSRHSPKDLAYLIKDHGFHDNFVISATIDEVREWLAVEEIPVIVHGYFTAFGHIIVIVGYDNSGFYVHDPYGEWTSSGYKTSANGSYLHYSYRLIRRLCIPDGYFWVHFVQR